MGIPAHFFTGWTPIIMARLENADPVHLDEVGRRFRDLKVIIAFADPWIDQCTLLVAKHPNFHADLYHYAELGPEPLFEALDRFRSLSALDRVLYGSNNSDKVRVGRAEATVPDVYHSVNRVARERGAEPFTDEQMAAILGGSAARLYGLGRLTSGNDRLSPARNRGARARPRVVGAGDVRALGLGSRFRGRCCDRRTLGRHRIRHRHDPGWRHPPHHLPPRSSPRPPCFGSPTTT